MGEIKEGSGAAPKIPIDKTMHSAQPVGNAAVDYEQLQNIAHQLQQQNEYYKQELGRLYQDNSLMRLEYLIKIIENQGMYPKALIVKAIAEVGETMYPTEEEE